MIVIIHPGTVVISTLHVPNIKPRRTHATSSLIKRGACVGGSESRYLTLVTAGFSTMIVV